MSWVEVRLAEFDSPERARSLFKVRAEISFARPLLSPRLLALASMCWYCRSRLGLDPRGIPDTSWFPNLRSGHSPAQTPLPAAPRSMRGGIARPLSAGRAHVELVSRRSCRVAHGVLTNLEREWKRCPLTGKPGEH